MKTTVNLLQDIKQSGIVVVSDLIKDFEAYKNKIADSVILFQDYDTGKYKTISRKNTSRYFPEGRTRIRKKIYSRLGHFQDSAVMITLEYNPHKIGRIEAWSRFNTDTTLFIKSLNQYLRRKIGKGYKNIGYLRSVEQIPFYRENKGKLILDDDNMPIPNKSGGYPHIHLVFPNKRFLISIVELERLWHYGMTQIKRYDNCNIVGYLVSYISKMENWGVEAQALVWYMGKRLYSYSRRYTLPKYDIEKTTNNSYIGTLNKKKLNSCTYEPMKIDRRKIFIN